MGYSHPHVLPICRLKAHLLMVKPHIIDTKVTMHPIYSPYFCCLQQISTVFSPFMMVKSTLMHIITEKTHIHGESHGQN